MNASKTFEIIIMAQSEALEHELLWDDDVKNSGMWCNDEMFGLRYLHNCLRWFFSVLAAIYL